MAEKWIDDFWGTLINDVAWPSGHVNTPVLVHLAATMKQDNLSVVLAERPTGAIIPGQTFHQKTTPIPSPADLQDGQILVETVYLSLDPAMRGWLNGEKSISMNPRQDQHH